MGSSCALILATQAGKKEHWVHLLFDHETEHLVVSSPYLAGQVR